MTTEEYIKAYTKTCSNQLSFVDGDKRPMFAPWLTPDHARNVAQMTKEHMINKAVEWLKDELEGYDVDASDIEHSCGRFMEYLKLAEV